MRGFTPAGGSRRRALCSPSLPAPDDRREPALATTVVCGQVITRSTASRLPERDREHVLAQPRRPEHRRWPRHRRRRQHDTKNHAGRDRDLGIFAAAETLTAAATRRSTTGTRRNASASYVTDPLMSGGAVRRPSPAQRWA